MTEEASNNVINNFKGVMLCSRPNEKKAPDVEKPFCGRVVPGELLGLNPVPKGAFEDYPKHKKITVLEKHKWLNDFKTDIHKTNEQLEERAKKEEEKFKKIREQAEADRERARKMKEEYNQAATQVLNVLDEKSSPPPPSNELTPDNLRRLDAQNAQEKKPKGQEFKKKKGEKPAWAMTKEQVDHNEDKEVDELLDFFENNEIEDFSQNEEIKHLLVNLKDKIEKMKADENWKEREAERMQKAKEARNRPQEDQEDDKYSNFHVANSEGKSVASEKTQKKLEELRNKKNQQQEWDKFTTSQKSSVANLDEKIAKNLADEVLRNYPNLKGVHSNVSIRKLLEAEAAKVINEPIMRPVITTIVREKQPMNANTLPYLHRNPAI